MSRVKQDNVFTLSFTWLLRLNPSRMIHHLRLLLGRYRDGGSCCKFQVLCFLLCKKCVWSQSVLILIGTVSHGDVQERILMICPSELGILETSFVTLATCSLHQLRLTSGMTAMSSAHCLFLVWSLRLQFAIQN